MINTIRIRGVMDLSQADTQDLIAEMERRKFEGTKEIERPDPIYEKNNFLPLIETCESIMEDIVKQGYSKDSDHYIYESAMTCIYGSKVWDWINKYNEGC